MATGIKAIVFKTFHLEKTKCFFENVLKMKVKEASTKHFVIHSKGIRIVFVESASRFSIELYVSEEKGKGIETPVACPSSSGFERYKDPNDIHIILFTNNDK